MCRSTNRSGEPEVWFRIVHVAQVGHSGFPAAVHREQTVDIALGPKGAFENSKFGAPIRQVAAGQVINTSRSPRVSRGRQRNPKKTRVAEHLRKAIEWHALLKSGQIASQAEIARQESITRARVTQIMAMLRLAPAIQEKILSMPASTWHPTLSERRLRPIEAIADSVDQVLEFTRRFA